MEFSHVILIFEQEFSLHNLGYNTNNSYDALRVRKIINHISKGIEAASGATWYDKSKVSFVILFI